LAVTHIATVNCFAITKDRPGQSVSDFFHKTWS